VSNLLEAVNDWTIAINDKKSVVIAYIDYAKAFDSVSYIVNLQLSCRLMVLHVTF